MANITVWHGSTEDLEHLVKAIAKNCTCVANEGSCSAHKLLDDQQTMDRLAFIGHIRGRFTKDDAAA